jgi:hypothetical protein
LTACFHSSKFRRKHPPVPAPVGNRLHTGQQTCAFSGTGPSNEHAGLSGSTPIHAVAASAQAVRDDLRRACDVHHAWAHSNHAHAPPIYTASAFAGRIKPDGERELKGVASTPTPLRSPSSSTMQYLAALILAAVASLVAASPFASTSPAPALFDKLISSGCPTDGPLSCHNTTAVADVSTPCRATSELYVKPHF